MGVARRVIWVALAASTTFLGSARQARADGAFPEAQAVLLPRDRPDTIVLATTFGLVSTDDGGNVWHWSCEAANTPMVGGGQYTVGPPPMDRVYAKTDVGVAWSTNAACSWSVGGGVLAANQTSTEPKPFDVFPDPSQPARVFALAADTVNAAFRSLDGGATYTGPIFTSPPNGTLTGIESSASIQDTVYLTMYQGPGVHPQLSTSVDGGDTWTTTDLEPQLGSVVPSLAAVDPVDGRILYLRVISAAGAPEQYQGLAISRDGGLTWTIPLMVSKGSLVGFARLSAQTLLAVGQLAPVSASDVGAPTLFRSEDGGQTFETQSLSFHPLGLAQRDGIAYLATNNFVDGFAVTSSSDAGRTWTPRLKFRDIHDIKECVRASCTSMCNSLAGLDLFPTEVCANPGGGGGCVLAGPRGGAQGREIFASAAILAVCVVGLGARRLRNRRRL